ncbi:ABC transporter ATP-binding protein [Iamia majanohamensis]|uniref:ABC transporter ATP-binding protein n=1 Tax=Iamia majanohamensis TaxID=467976 RepID=A0AAF0BXE3_9ACTN|nr:ABC transporter ATP-binding protein [Iamia majanohamensis]WCO68980.1 ABC transporter ATP-binding protein [Iamia majanohamensis]
MPAPVAPPAPRPEPVVALSGVHRRFARVEALRGLSLTVDPGTITVLLGPNGAGKTTAIRVITGALGVHEGSVRVFGLDPDEGRDGEAVRRRCGIVSAKPALYDRLSGLDNLRYAAELYGLGWNAGTKERVMAAATRFGIQAALSDQVGGYSTGMKTRLALSRSVLHEPDLLLFDEPTSGLDPESSHAVLSMIKDMAADGTTVIMCTHLLLEAEGLAEQVVVMEGGLDIASGRPTELMRRFWPDDAVRLGAEDPGALDAVADLPGVRGVDAVPGRVGEVDVRVDDLRRVPELVVALTTRGVRLTRVSPHERSLEELYFAVRAPHIGVAASDGGLMPEAAARPDLAGPPPAPTPPTRPTEEASLR